MSSNASDEDTANMEDALKAICGFFYKVVLLFTNILTASGRNSYGQGSVDLMRQHHRLELSYPEYGDEGASSDEEEFKHERGNRGNRDGLASELLTEEQQA